MQANQTLTTLQEEDPVLYQQVHAQLVRELAQIDGEIMDCQRVQESKTLQVRRWVIMGVISHNFSRTILEEIAAKFIRIGSVPQGYFYPELYSTVKKDQSSRKDWLILLMSQL